MKISELKLNQEVDINGHPYKHQGIKKIRKQNFGLVQQRVFECTNKNSGFDYKYFDITFNKELKEENGKLIIK
jgi:hypothetical protein